MLTIAIPISSFGESCKDAIESIIANRIHVGQVRIIYPAYRDDATSMYPKWPEHRETLEKNNIGVFFDAKLNPDNLENATSVVVEVPPTCRLTLGAFDSIHNQIKSANATQTHFSLATSTEFRGFSLFHGFFIVLTVLDWFWNYFFEFNKLIQYTDVRGRFILKKGGKTFLPDANQFSWRLWNSNVMPKVYAGDTARLQGLDIISRLHNHSHMKFGLWLILFLPVWFILTSSWYSMISMAISFRSAWMGSYALTIWVVEILFCMLISGHYVKNPYNKFFYALFPIYFAFFPFILVYSKLLRI